MFEIEGYLANAILFRLSILKTGSRFKCGIFSSAQKIMVQSALKFTGHFTSWKLRHLLICSSKTLPMISFIHTSSKPFPHPFSTFNSQLVPMSAQYKLFKSITFLNFRYSLINAIKAGLFWSLTFCVPRVFPANTIHEYCTPNYHTRESVTT